MLVASACDGSVRFRGGDFRERRVMDIVFSVFDDGGCCWNSGEGSCMVGEEA